MYGSNRNKRSRVAGLSDNGVLSALIGEEDADHVPQAVEVSSDDSSNDTSAGSGSTLSPSSNNGFGETETGSVGEAANDEYGGLTAEEYEFQMGMMEAMENGMEGEEEEEGGAEDRDVPQEQEDRPGAEGDDEEAYALGMMAAMEDGPEDEPEGDEETYARGMMSAMEDGPEAEQQEHQDEAGLEEHQDPVVYTEEDAQNSKAAVGKLNRFGFTDLSNNIVQACSSVSNAVREYYRMSQSDQAQVWDDMTGYKANQRVFVEGKELPGQAEEFEPRQMVEEALAQLPLELERMPPSIPHNALDLALEKFPNYVNDRAFQLKFLRADKFDVFAAAARMCRHFEIKLEVFGEECLGREITMDDLDEDDMAAFKTGYIQVLQDRDYGHRPVLFYYKAVSSECYKRRENILRAYWYLTNKISETEEVQKLGISNVVYNNGGFPRQGMDYEKSRRIAQMMRSAPLRFNNFYVCLDDKPWLTVVETFAIMMTRFLRVRLRMLRGTREEVLEKLSAVGVPGEAVPVNSENELLVDAHLDWLEKQREEEEESRKQEVDTSNLNWDVAGNPFAVKGDYKLRMDTVAHLPAVIASGYGGGPPSA